MRLTICLLLAAGTAFPQLFSFGAKIGVPATDLAKSSFQFTNGRYVVGPELRLPFRFSVEFDALYRTLGLRSLPPALTSVNGSVWEFPLLGKYRFSGEFVSPFVDAGFAFNTIQGLSNVSKTNNSSGFVLGGGLEGKLVFIRITPELRYTHWQTVNLQNPVTGLSFSNQNQFEAMVGITF